MSQLDSKTLLTQTFSLGSITVDPQNICISFQQTRLNCEPKVFQILLYFCQHPEQVISREQLLEDLWQGRVVSDNAVNRKIYQLRKLIAELDNSKEYIETIPKHGYRLLQPIEIIKESTEKSINNNQNSKASQTTQKSRLSTFLHQWWLSPMLLAITFVIISQFNFHSPPIPLKLEQITANQGVEQNASLSPDGNILVYSHSPNGLGHQLMINNIATGHTQAATELQSKVYDIMAQWHPKEHKVAFIRLSYKNDQKTDKTDKKPNQKYQQTRQCEVHQLTLSSIQGKQEFDTSSQKIADCESANIPVISWGEKSDLLYIAQRQKKTLPYNIHSINLTTGAKEQLTRSKQGSNMSGHYYINRNLDGSQLVVLEYLSSEKVAVKIYNSEDFTLQNQFELNAHIKNIAWQPHTEQLYFRRGNYIEKVKIDGSDKQTVFHLGSAFNDLNFDNSGDRLLLSTSANNTDIYQYSTQNVQLNETLIASNKRDLRPRYANNKSTIAFISDRNGSKQFWIQSQGQQAKLIKGYSFDIGTPDFKWSPDDSHILYEYHGQIYTLDLATTTTKVLLDSSHKAYNSSWSQDGSKIIYSSTKTGDWQLWALDIASNNHQQITSKGGYSGFLATDGQLYFSKYHQNGLYRINTSGVETQLIEDFSLLNWLNWRLKNNNIYFARVWLGAQQPGIYQYNIATEKETLIMSHQQGLLHDYSVSKDGENIAITRHISQTGDILMLTGLNQQH